MKINSLARKSGVLKEREQLRLRRESELRGVPLFALRLLASRRFMRVEHEPILRNRHD